MAINLEAFSVNELIDSVVLSSIFNKLQIISAVVLAVIAGASINDIWSFKFWINCEFKFLIWLSDEYVAWVKFRGRFVVGS